VVDLTGRMVFTEVVNAMEGTNIHQVDLTHISKGMYLIVVENGSVKDQLRIIVQ